MSWSALYSPGRSHTSAQRCVGATLRRRKYFNRMKLLVIASSLDLQAPLSSTPSWWQLLKALAEQGADLVVAPYQGPPIESPWWTAAANPAQREGDLVGWAKRLAPSRAVQKSTTGTRFPT